MKRTPEVLGSFFSVVAGILACSLTWCVGLFVSSLFSGGNFAEAASGGFIFAFFVLLIGGAMAMATWAAVFLWIYLFVPMSSPLWKWPICTLCGGLAGGLIVSAIALCYGMENGTFVLFVSSGILTGASSCLFAALTVRRFKYHEDRAEERQPLTPPRPCRSGSSRFCL